MNEIMKKVRISIKCYIFKTFHGTLFKIYTTNLKPVSVLDRKYNLASLYLFEK